MRAWWVCDGCLAVLNRKQVADWTDGEHVFCYRCVQERKAAK